MRFFAEKLGYEAVPSRDVDAQESGEEHRPASSSTAADNGNGNTDGGCFPEMSWSMRIQGYLLFTALGFFSSFMGMLAFSTGAVWKYAVLSTIGQIMSLMSTILLMGPKRQLEAMFDQTRRTTTLCYLGSVACTLVVAVWLRSPLLCFICGMIQYGALIWYSLSYIPYGREFISTMMVRCSKAVVNGI